MTKSKMNFPGLDNNFIIYNQSRCGISWNNSPQLFFCGKQYPKQSSKQEQNYFESNWEDKQIYKWHGHIIKSFWEYCISTTSPIGTPEF